ncbi:tRNA (adenosine(37)-N6)-threonylcarbamoyltransferase complex ATPase subunit type 1 TsaE [Thiotrichales bacterium 19S3-7]|nr:tRNA (adenosine(37)-N6)-threonylcarbamoyltransferase complex ATPase subunit type 1 TsaE [Thiotrichales bacterium 19S3-7]MCF6801318.1 tRNA (adenosine(37)-N6)-threonylcarbamoyltransferase complex ATPase subunit type 1 TsaE [Thiotrichales bacterium 19S3-11]
MIKTLDEQAMIAYGMTFAKQLKKGDKIYLYGDLGAGKTTLVKGILRGLGYKGLVKSPTYALVESYELEHVTAYHFDLYRLGEPEELEWLGIRDYFNEESICLIEWPQKGGDFLPKANYTVNIEYLGEDAREVKIIS